MTSRRDSATVLVVDDEEILTRLMFKILEKGGFQVLWANNGADALTLFRRAEPPVDLLVTDYKMPGMTGLELASACCSLNPDLGVLYISGSSAGDDLGADLAVRKRDFLAKPFRQSDLLRSVRTVLAMELEAAPSRENHWPSLERMGMEG